MTAQAPTTWLVRWRLLKLCLFKFLCKSFRSCKVYNSLNKCYRHKGIAIIISNENFTYSQVKGRRRAGSEVDTETFSKTLVHLGFDYQHIKIHRNQTVNQIQALLSQGDNISCGIYSYVNQRGQFLIIF